jgi:hypothetical protein
MSRLTSVAVAGLLAGTALLVGGAPAQAAGPTTAVAVSCSGMVNPVNATSTATRKSTALPGGRTLALRSGTIGGVQYAWSRISSANNGEYIWIDISGDNKRTWKQCDLRQLSSSGRNYSNALRTSNSSDVCMRAGYRPTGAGSSYLTDWWC